MEPVWKQIPEHIRRLRVRVAEYTKIPFSFKSILPMNPIWNKIPEQIRRLSVLVVLLVVLLIAVRYVLRPADFGKYGHYRASAVDAIIAQNALSSGVSWA